MPLQQGQRMLQSMQVPLLLLLRLLPRRPQMRSWRV
jgi:hypothetical protein